MRDIQLSKYCLWSLGDMVIGNYRLLKEIGRGGMGAVYEAEHVVLGRPVAVKVLDEEYAKEPESCRRFMHEARASSQIQHPNVVDVTDFGLSSDGRLYFVMELCRGNSLSDLVAEGPMPLFRALGILGQITRALAEAHKLDVVHRDLKPENILLEPRQGRREIVRVVEEGDKRSFLVENEGDFDFVRIIDFGIAKIKELAESKGMIVGTPSFMAPEQILGRPTDSRTDIYAVGVLFFEMLTGALPFTGKEPKDVCRKHVGEPPPLPSLVRPDVLIPKVAEQVIIKALSKSPDRRQQTMDELHDELQLCFSGTFFKRDAHLIPGARDSGILPGQRGR